MLSIGARHSRILGRRPNMRLGSSSYESVECPSRRQFLAASAAWFCLAPTSAWARPSATSTRLLTVRSPLDTFVGKVLVSQGERVSKAAVVVELDTVILEEKLSRLQRRK